MLRLSSDFKYPARVQAALNSPRLKSLKSENGEVQFLCFYSTGAVCAPFESKTIEDNFSKLVELIETGLEEGWLEPRFLGEPGYKELAWYELHPRVAFYCFVESKLGRSELNKLYRAKYGDGYDVFVEEGCIGKELFTCPSCGK